jgi:hypothetical protein
MKDLPSKYHAKSFALKTLREKGGMAQGFAPASSSRTKVVILRAAEDLLLRIVTPRPCGTVF